MTQSLFLVIPLSSLVILKMLKPIFLMYQRSQSYLGIAQITLGNVLLLYGQCPYRSNTFPKGASFVQRDSWSQSRCIDLWSHVPFLQVTQRVSHINSHITVELRIMNFKTRFSRKTSFQTVLSFSNTQASFLLKLRRKFHMNLLYPVLFYCRILP